MLNTARQVGGALGIAVLGAVAAGRITGHWNQFVSSLPAASHQAAAHVLGLVQGGQLGPIGQLGGPIARQAATSAFMSGFHAAMWTASALCVSAAVIALVGLRTGHQARTARAAIPA